MKYIPVALYILPAMAGGRLLYKRCSFYVSAFTYNGYHINEHGPLTCKGDRVIDFQ